MLKYLTMLLIAASLLAGCVGSEYVTTPDTSTTVPPTPTYPKSCLTPDEQQTNILPNPCFVGLYPYVYDQHTWDVPLQYRPVFQRGVGGESYAKVNINDSGLEFDLTYFSGRMSLAFRQSVQAGTTYLLIFRGSSTLRVNNGQLASNNFSAEGTLSVGGVITQLSPHSIGVPTADSYGGTYQLLTGDREFIWVIYADNNLDVDFEVGLQSIWKLGQHGSTFVGTSLALIPILWDGTYDELVVIRH